MDLFARGIVSEFYLLVTKHVCLENGKVFHELLMQGLGALDMPLVVTTIYFAISQSKLCVMLTGHEALDKLIVSDIKVDDDKSKVTSVNTEKITNNEFVIVAIPATKCVLSRKTSCDMWTVQWVICMTYDATFVSNLLRVFKITWLVDKYGLYIFAHPIMYLYSWFLLLKSHGELSRKPSCLTNGFSLDKRKYSISR